MCVALCLFLYCCYIMQAKKWKIHIEMFYMHSIGSLHSLVCCNRICSLKKKKKKKRFLSLKGSNWNKRALKPTEHGN